MTDNSSSSPYADRQQQARGVFGLFRALGTMSERVFRRSYADQEATVPASLPLAPDSADLIAQIRSRETQIEHLTTILQSISEGVIMQDNDGRIIVMNEAAYQLLGSQKAFWEGPLARLHARAEDATQFAPGLEPLGSPARVEINDRILGAQVGAISDDNGQRMGTLIVLRDITREALGERLKDEFITQVSHELRTPLTVIKGMSDVMLGQPDRPPDRRFLEAISRNVDVLDRMIVELLDISEINAGTFAVRQHALVLDDLVWSVIRGLAPRLERASLEVQTMPINRAHTGIPGDNRRLRWALGHIIENSINYTLPGGVITVRVGELRDGYALIQVEDTGVGISELDLPRVCNRFYRGEARTADNRLIDPRGLGQGLFIARAVAEAHGGYLGIESKVGVGTLVTLALPVGGLKSAANDSPGPALSLPPEVS